MSVETDIQQCVKILTAGGIILYPTDTVWGLGCDATNADAVEKIYFLKKRPGEKSAIVLVADERDIIKYVANPDLRVFDYLKTVAKPTTVIYPSAIGLAPNLLANDGSIGIRIASDDFTRQLIKRYRKPVVSTSANISGDPAPANFAAISDAIKNGVDYIVRHRQEDERLSTPSTIIRFDKTGNVIVIRE